MLKNIFLWITQNIFKIKTETTEKEISNNTKYASAYKDIDDINFSAVFSNKLANYVVSDSNLNIEGDNARGDMFNKMGQSMWKKAKKIVSMGFGYGGLVMVPYVKGGKLYYNLVTQDRLIINEIDGELITDATLLADIKKEKTLTGNDKVSIRWTNYKVKNGKVSITYKYTDDEGNKIDTPDYWKDIQDISGINNVDRVLFGYIKSPINNRKSNDKYGVPITYGCDATIIEIKNTMKQIIREYELKEPFVGVDATLFDGKNSLPKSGLWRRIDSGKDDFFEVFDPAFRDYTTRLQELYKRLEHEIGTSYGILSEVQTNQATATEIKRSMYDTFTICDDMRSNIEKGFEDFFYACNVLANAYNLVPQGDYNVSFDWSYSLLEDTGTEWTQLTWAYKNGIEKDVELRQWLHPDETLEESQKAIDEIKESQKDVDDLLGTKNEFNDM